MLGARERRFAWCFGLGIALAIGTIPSAKGQQDGERPGGYPVDGQAQQRGAGGDGFEEGMPEVRGRQFGNDNNPQFRTRVVPRQNWRLGVYGYNSETGVVITRVVRNTPAFREGLEQGDRIVAVNGYQVGIVGNRMYLLGEELQRRADRRGTVLLLVQNVRNRELLTMTVQLESPNQGPVRPFGIPRDGQQLRSDDFRGDSRDREGERDRERGGERDRGGERGRDRGDQIQ